MGGRAPTQVLILKDVVKNPCELQCNDCPLLWRRSDDVRECVSRPSPLPQWWFAYHGSCLVVVSCIIVVSVCVAMNVGMLVSCSSLPSSSKMHLPSAVENGGLIL